MSWLTDSLRLEPDDIAVTIWLALTVTCCALLLVCCIYMYSTRGQHNEQRTALVSATSSVE